MTSTRPRPAGLADLDRLAMAVLQPGFDGTTPPEWVLRALGDGLGGAVLFARNIVDHDQTAELVAALRAENPRVIVAVDEEGGNVTRLESATGSSWPGNLALGVADDVSRTRRVARQIGRLVAAADITLDYAPVVDVNADPLNPVIGVRSFGADPDLVARHGVAWIEGLQSVGVAACAKHFPGHGDTVTDSHLALPTVHAPRDTLDRRDLPPFRAAVAAGVRAIMCGHLLVPALDGRPATLSRDVLTGLIREELGFEGLVVTDAIEMRAIAAYFRPGEIAVRALAAGADAVCVGISSPGGENVYELRDAIVAAVREGRLAEERLAEAGRRVAELVEWHAARAPVRAAALADRDEHAGQEAAEAALKVVRGPGGAETPGRGRRDSRRPEPGVPEPGGPVVGVAPLVVELTPRPSQAVGPPLAPVPTHLPAAFDEVLPGTVGLRGTPEDGLPDLDAHAGRPLVLGVYDAARYGWIRELLAEAVRRRPDAVVIETGVPGTPVGALYVTTHGNSLVSARAAARSLTTTTGRGTPAP